MEGKLTGIGVGPGDPELLTLKAVRAITESDILILPGRSRDDCYAYRIVQKALPEVAEKEFMLADFPMMKDKEVLKAAWEKTAEEICRLIDAGKKVAFLTIGDPVCLCCLSLYSPSCRAAGKESGDDQRSAILLQRSGKARNFAWRRRRTDPYYSRKLWSGRNDDAFRHPNLYEVRQGTAACKESTERRGSIPGEKR